MEPATPADQPASAVLNNPRQRTAGGGRVASQDEIPLNSRPSLTFLFAKALLWVACRFLFRIHTKGLWRMRRQLRKLPKDKPVIFIANHHSMLDGVLLMLFTPSFPKPHALAAIENLTPPENAGWKRKVLWQVVKRAGAIIAVDRGAEKGKGVDFPTVYRYLRPEPLQRPDTRLGRVARAVRGRLFPWTMPRPISIVGFPTGRLDPVEGRFGMHKPKAGFTEFAINTGATVIPIGINGTSRLWFWRRIDLRFGRPVAYEPSWSKERRLGAEMEAIEGLIEPYRARVGPKYMQKVLPQQRKKFAAWRAEREAAHPEWRVRNMLPELFNDANDELAASQINTLLVQAEPANDVASAAKQTSELRTVYVRDERSNRLVLRPGSALERSVATPETARNKAPEMPGIGE